MIETDMYLPAFDALDIFKALKKVKKDELLPEEGVFNFFYEQSQYPGITFFLRHKNRVKLFYIDHEEFINEIKDQNPAWEITIEKSLVRIILLYKVRDTVVPVNFLLDIFKKDYRDLVIAIRKKKEVKLYFFPMLYGGLVFDSYRKLKVPSKILDVLKDIK